MPATRTRRRASSPSAPADHHSAGIDDRRPSTHLYVGGKPGETSVSVSAGRRSKRRRSSIEARPSGHSYVGQKPPAPAASAPPIPSSPIRYAGKPPRKKRIVVVSDDSDVEGPSYIGRPPKSFRKPRLESSPSLPQSETVAETAVESEAPPEPSTLYDDDVVEEEDVVIDGENPADEDDEDGEIPVRLLRDVVVYDDSQKARLVALEELRSSPSLDHIRISGIVSGYVEDDSSDEEDDQEQRQRVKLSHVTEFSVHWVESSSRFRLDPKIYVRTPSAWYILGSPAECYKEQFLPFWIKHRIFDELVTFANRNPAFSLEDLVESLDVDDEIDDMVEGGITMEHVKDPDTCDYVVAAFSELEEERPGLCNRIRKVPAVRYFLSRPKLEPRESPEALGPEEGIEDGPEGAISSSGDASRSRSQTVRTTDQPEDTVVMPRVAEICKPLYPMNSFLVVGEESSETAALPPDVPRQKHATFKGNPNRIEWVTSSRTAPHHYRSVIIDGTQFNAGETVTVEPGRDDDLKRHGASLQIESSNPFARSKWFMKICYMFEHDGEKMFHGQFYYHGATCIPRQTAHPYGLFLSDLCGDTQLATIYQKCNVHVLEPTDDEPEVTTKDNVYFTGLYWDQRHTKIFERSKEEVQAALKTCKRGRPCVACGIDKLSDERTAWTLYPDGHLSHGEVPYHVNDFVYIMPTGTETDVYVIGQIVEIHPGDDGEDPNVDVRLYERCDLIFRNETKNEVDFGTRETDERRLFRSDKFLDSVNVLLIEGKAFVVHTDSLTPEELDEWCLHDDHFHARDHCDTNRPPSSDEFRKLRQTSFKKCNECYEARVAQLEDEKHLKETHEPLRGLELFAGAGGLSTGFDQSGFVKTMWAVELGASACKTYAANHPYATVYNHSVNKMLQHAVETFEGHKPEPLFTELGEKLPPMPKPGDVDFIYGGPPCQGFSRMNHSRKADDFRNTLVCNMLSYVEFYRPRFFMLENVEGLLYHPLAATQNGQNKLEGGIRSGVVKLITRVLSCLGYQVHFKLLQAGQYGAPQSRLRVIFLGARRGLPLPDFPIPMHCTPDDVPKHTFEHGVSLWPAVRCIPDEDTRQGWLQFAPLLRVSVEDAISDLPKFDWIDPHEIWPKHENDDGYEVAQRKAKGIKQFDALLDRANERLYSGFVEETPYASPPLSRYQKWMRRDMEEDEGVTYQYTSRFSAIIVERVVNVPLRGDACHVDLPLVLRDRNLFTPDGKPKPTRMSLYGRINGKWNFSTALTTAKPNNKGGKVLHPNQKRVLTIRETARAQGFPDSQQFLSTNKNPLDDQLRQIGNAVPVPLALALGKAIGKVLLKIWKEEDEREVSPDVSMDIDD